MNGIMQKVVKGTNLQMELSRTERNIMQTYSGDNRLTIQQINRSYLLEVILQPISFVGAKVYPWTFSSGRLYSKLIERNSLEQWPFDHG